MEEQFESIDNYNKDSIGSRQDFAPAGFLESAREAVAG
jgi:hypothetical protein